MTTQHGDLPDLHWSDPEFLEWEREQVGDVTGHEDDDVPAHRGETIRYYAAAPGTQYVRQGRYDVGVHIRPMIQVVSDHLACDECDG